MIFDISAAVEAAVKAAQKSAKKVITVNNPRFITSTTDKGEKATASSRGKKATAAADAESLRFITTASRLDDHAHASCPEPTAGLKSCQQSSACKGLPQFFAQSYEDPLDFLTRFEMVGQVYIW